MLTTKNPASFPAGFCPPLARVRCSPSNGRSRKETVVTPMKRRHDAVLHCGLYIPNEPQTVAPPKQLQCGITTTKKARHSAGQPTMKLVQVRSDAIFK